MIKHDYKYNRELPTGLGDRLGVYMCLAALGKLLGIKIHAIWYTNRDKCHPSQSWCCDFEVIKKYIKLPDSIVFHSSDEINKMNIHR